MISRFVLSLALSIALPPAGKAGPFGVEMGADIDNLDVGEEGFKPSLNSVPKPHPLFREYAVWHSNETGVCRIMAISNISENDRYGDDVRSSFSRVKRALEKKYGEGEAVEYLRSGALWDEPDEWVMAIHQSERTHAYVWNDVSSDDGDAFSLIQLWIEAVSSDTAFVILEYRSPDFDACNDSIEASQNSAF